MSFESDFQCTTENGALINPLKTNNTVQSVHHRHPNFNRVSACAYPHYTLMFYMSVVHCAILTLERPGFFECTTPRFQCITVHQ
jgi:hypothetical protein